MRARQFIVELRQGLAQYIKQQFSSWPEYVVRDLLYKGIKGMPNQDEAESWLSHIKKEYPVRQWKLEKLDITVDIFTPDTQQKIKSRKGGTANPLGVPNDAERHAQQQTMIQKQGVSNEPVIVLKRPNGYELLEGWHRTIQHLQAYPEGYQGPAWVGYL